MESMEKLQADNSLISIHLMLWFYKVPVVTSMTAVSFQYISCYGSIGEDEATAKAMVKFQYISCYGSIYT